MEERFVEVANSNGYRGSVDVSSISIDLLDVAQIPPTAMPTAPTPMPSVIPTYIPPTNTPTSTPTTQRSVENEKLLGLSLHILGLVAIVVVIAYSSRGVWYPSRSRKMPETIDPTFSMFRRHALYSSIEDNTYAEDSTTTGNGYDGAESWFY